jgi:proline dehydrogenase
LREELLSGGHRVRVYVPFGPQWYAYSMRRLRENPQVVTHIVRAMVGLK